MGLYHTQPLHVPSTPPYWLASDDHFLKRMPTDPLSSVVQLMNAINNSTAGMSASSR